MPFQARAVPESFLVADRILGDLRGPFGHLCFSKKIETSHMASSRFAVKIVKCIGPKPMPCQGKEQNTERVTVK